MKSIFLNSITDISAQDWNSVVKSDYPFMRHEFLAAMELSQSACTKSGWTPQHLVVSNDDELIAVMPLYLKDHSYGEYIFDWSWAGAYERYGLDYYPKLLSAIPFTPATGSRLAYLDSVDQQQIYSYISQILQAHAVEIEASSIHILLPDKQETSEWAKQGLATRTTSQFHWFNDGYQNFDDFLEKFSSRKRKNLKKERRRISEQGISMRVLTGSEITSELWDVFYDFYQLTYAKRSGHGGYLKRGFFDLLSESMSEQVMLVLAEYEGRYVAGALYFYSSSTLYGRYWGCTHEFEMLHFEACYYQGIEFCIAKGLDKFDAGAQGEHKIQRGFTPIPIWSNHWIKDKQFSDAVNDFIVKEAEGNLAYIENAKDYLPFKKESE
ncbi:MAG: putative N-acyltransferase [Oceanicoccus sp.]|jgi:predicted N-acyltransferase